MNAPELPPDPPPSDPRHDSSALVGTVVEMEPTVASISSIGIPQDSAVIPSVPLPLEMGAVFCLGVLPHLVYSIQSPFGSGLDTSSFTESLIQLTFSSVQIVVPLLLILWIQRVDWTDFGIQQLRWFWDPVTGVLFYYLAIGAGHLGYYAPALLGFDFVYQLDWSYTFSQPTTEPLAVVLSLTVVASIANALAEELVMRSYFITRLKHWGVGSMPAILGASFVFAAYHTYQGLVTTLGVFFIGTLFGAYFSAERRLWPLVIAHALLDMVAIVQGI